MLLGLQTAQADPMSFTGVGDIPGRTFASRATAVSGNGRVVFGSSDGVRLGDCTEPIDGDPALGCPEEDHAFRWTPESGIVALEASCDGGGGQICGGGVAAASYDGSLAVGVDHGGGGDDEDAPAWWYPDGSVGGVGNDGGAGDVSSDGRLVVGGVGDSYPRPSGAFLYDREAGVFTSLGTLPDPVYSGASGASGISGDGDIVVGTSSSGDGYQAFVWTEADGMQALNDLSGGALGFGTTAYGISTDGNSIYGTRNDGGAFLWRDGIVTEMGDFQPSASSADGSTVVGTDDSWTTAYIWDETNGLRDLQTVLAALGFELDGWTLQGAGDISDDGKVIVGWGLNPDGNQEGWVVVIPEPSTLALVGAGLVCMAGRLAQRRNDFR